jgi:flagellar hook-length control protein FliK
VEALNGSGSAPSKLAAGTATDTSTATTKTEPPATSLTWSQLAGLQVSTESVDAPTSEDGKPATASPQPPEIPLEDSGTTIDSTLANSVRQTALRGPNLEDAQPISGIATDGTDLHRADLPIGLSAGTPSSAGPAHAVVAHAPFQPGMAAPSQQSPECATSESTNALGSPRTLEHGQAAEEKLTKNPLAMPATREVSESSSSTTEKPDDDSRGSGQSSQSGSLDPTHDYQTLSETSTSPVTHSPERSTAARETSFADQVYGEIATRVEVAHRDGRIDFRLRLDPPGLGTVHVHLSATGHSVTAKLLVEDPVAQQVIESQLHVLRDSLAGLGVSLENLSTGRGDGGSPGPWRWSEPQPATPVFSDGPDRAAQRAEAPRLRTPSGIIDVVV